MWNYLTQSEAATFLWHTSAAQEWGLEDFTKMVQAIESDSLYGYITNDRLIAIARLSWIVPSISAYLWIWVEDKLRRTTEVGNIFTSLYKLVFGQLRVKKLIGACLEKSHAKLCVRYGAELKCVLPNLYHKNKSGYICMWDLENYNG